MVQLLNGDQIVSTHTTTLPLPDLPSSAGHAHIFPDLTNHLLTPWASYVTMDVKLCLLPTKWSSAKMANPLSWATNTLKAYGQHHYKLQPHSGHKPILCMTNHLHPPKLSNFFMHPFSAQPLPCCLPL